MAKPTSTKTSDFEEFAHLDLHELESQIKTLGSQPPTPETKNLLRTLRQAVRDRQRHIKATVMEFEQTNNRHLLVYDSTDNFSKIAGRSVLFYTITIADRIHRRYNVKNDTDDYSRSDYGIVSIRSLEQLEIQLAEINIFPDHKLSTPELHFYKLAKIYTDEQIAKLRDRSRQDIERITSIIVPKSPVPDLYNLILELNRLVYYNCRRISDGLARETLLRQIILDANELLISYLNFANARSHIGLVRQPIERVSFATTVHTNQPPTSPQAANLLNILLNTRNLRNSMANLENLRLLHHRELCEILEKLVLIERLAAREYSRQQKRDASANSTAE